MAKHDSTELLALAVCGTIDGSPLGATAHQPPSDPRSNALSPVLGLIQMETLKNVFMRRVGQAVATIADVSRHREATILSHSRIGAGLLEKFDVKGVEDIPSNQFSAAHQFLESFVLDFGPIAKARA